VDQPAHLPKTIDDLVEWSVYADYLQTRNDRRGLMIARDLAGTPMQQRTEGGPTVTWCMGHVKALFLRRIPRYGFGRHAHDPDEGTLANARDLMKRPVGRLVEEIELDFGTSYLERPWRRFLAAIPPTCTRVGVWVDGEIDLDKLVAWLPQHVTVLEVHRADRLPIEALQRAKARFDVIAWRTAAPIPELHGSDTPAILDRRTGLRTTLAPWPSWFVQRQWGILPVRRWIDRTFGQRYWVTRDERDGTLRVRSGRAGPLVRFAGDWMGGSLPSECELVP
jgi:hypothetical protein